MGNRKLVFFIITSILVTAAARGGLIPTKSWRTGQWLITGCFEETQGAVIAVDSGPLDDNGTYHYNAAQNLPVAATAGHQHKFRGL